MSNSVWPHRWQPTRLPHPWGSPGKNTGVGCHFLLQCMKVKSESEVAQSCPTLSDPMDCTLPGSSNHGIFQARVLEWGAICALEESISPVLCKFWQLYCGLMVTSSYRAYALPRSTSSRAPAPTAVHWWHVPLQETFKYSSVLISVGSLGPGAHEVYLSPLSIFGVYGVWF